METGIIITHLRMVQVIQLVELNWNVHFKNTQNKMYKNLIIFRVLCK